jgi:hypothetical protein
MVPSADTLGMARCRAPTLDGTLCKRKVKQAGQRCYWHSGMRAAPKSRVRQRKRKSSVRMLPPPSPRRKASPAARREQRQQDRVRKAAEYCAEAVYQGWPEIVADRALTYVSQPTWDRLLRGRHKSRCQALARIASELLTTKQGIHDALGFLAARLVRFFGGGNAVQAFIGELVSNIPLPFIDAKIIAAARGAQVAGILLCVMEGSDLTACQCFRDLALEMTKTQVRKLLIVAMGDWRGLADFMPRDSTSAALRERHAHGTGGP